jgi:hypothetical protein
VTTSGRLADQIASTASATSAGSGGTARAGFGRIQSSSTSPAGTVVLSTSVGIST